jgi:hypothetical protein
MCRVSSLSGACSETKSDSRSSSSSETRVMPIFFRVRLRARTPVQQPHPEAFGAPRGRLADAAAAADQTNGLAVHQRAGQMI